MYAQNMIRQVCRACHNINFIEPGTWSKDASKDYRCDPCENADYERYHFDKNLPDPNAVAQSEPEAPVDATPAPPAEDEEDTSTPAISGDSVNAPEAE